MAPKAFRMNDGDLPLRQQLAELKRVPLEQVGRIRMTEQRMPSLVDVGVILTGKEARHAAEDLRGIISKHPDLAEKIGQIKFGGRGNHETPVPQDLPTLIEVIFLLPGRAAAQVRQAAAQIFVRYLGGDLSLIGEVERLRHVQETLGEADPGHPLRLFGAAVEKNSAAALQLSRRGLLLVRKCHLKQQQSLRRVQADVSDLQRAFTLYTTSMEGREEHLLVRLAQHGEQLSMRVVFAMQKSLQPLTDAVAAIRAIPFNVTMSVRSSIRDVVDKAVTGVNSTLVKAFRSATKGPARRKSVSSTAYPEDQRATEVQQLLESVSLASVAHELCPEITYPGWRSVRSSFGQLATQERRRRHELPREDPDHVAKPLLWSYAGVAVEGGGVRRLFLKTEVELLKAVWCQERRDGSLHARAVERSRELPPEPWPQHVAELEPLDFEGHRGK
jgi:hypothetical protein